MKKYPGIILTFLVLIILSCSQHSKNEYFFISGFTQGTTYHITYQFKEHKTLKPEIDSILNQIDLSLSIYNPSSVISRINKNDTSVVCDEYFKNVFNKSIEIAEKTNGAFDITIAPVVNAWGFGSENKKDIDSALIDSLLQFVGYQRVKLNNNKITKPHPNIKLDANAIAQGYSADVIAGFLEKRQISNYLVEIGGEVKAKGKNKNNEYWRIGIDKPVEKSTEQNRELQTIIQLNNKSLATSGNYRKFFEENGVKYSHTINPKTGYPVKHNLLSVTVITDDCITADAYATAFMVLGLDESMRIVKNNPELEAYFICSPCEIAPHPDLSGISQGSGKNGEYQVYYTEGIKKLILEN